MSKSVYLRLEKELLKELEDIAKDKEMTAQVLLSEKIEEWLSADVFLAADKNWNSYDKPTKKTNLHLSLDKTIFEKLTKITKDLKVKNIQNLLRIKIGAWLAIPIFIDDGEYWSASRKLE